MAFVPLKRLQLGAGNCKGGAGASGDGENSVEKQGGAILSLQGGTEGNKMRKQK